MIPPEINPQLAALLEEVIANSEEEQVSVVFGNQTITAVKDGSEAHDRKKEDALSVLSVPHQFAGVNYIVFF